MKITPGDIKKLLRSWDVLCVIESGNRGKGFDRKLTARRIKKIRNNRSIENLLKRIESFRECTLSESEKLDSFEQGIIKDIISHSSVSLIADKHYTGTSTVYRVMDSFGDRLYKRMINDKYFEQTVNYLINRLQKYI